MDRRRLIGLTLVVISAFAYGSGGLFAQPVYAAGVDWLVLSSYRFLFGALLGWVAVLAWPSRRAAVRRIGRRTAIASIGLGVLFVGNSGTYYAGLEKVSPSLAALIAYFYPALVAVLSLRFGRRLEGARVWFALVLALVGVVLTIGGIDPNDAPPALSLALVVASPIIYAVWIILAARLSGERRDAVADDASGGDEALATAALMMTATAVVYWVAALVVGRPVLPMAIPVAAWPGLIGVGAISSFVAIQGFYLGARRLGAAQATLVATIEPLWTVVLAAIIYGYALLPLQVVGGLLILASVVIAQAPGLDIARLRVRLADE